MHTTGMQCPPSAAAAWGLSLPAIMAGEEIVAAAGNGVATPAQLAAVWCPLPATSQGKWGLLPLDCLQSAI